MLLFLVVVVMVLVLFLLQECGDSRRGKTSKVLVYPYDIRIPKVRISTRQAEDLKNHRLVMLIGHQSAIQ